MQNALLVLLRAAARCAQAKFGGTELHTNYMKLALDPTEVCTSCTNFSFLGEHGKARAVASRATNSIFPEPHRGLLEPFGGRSAKTFKMTILGAPWGQLAANARKHSN